MYNKSSIKDVFQQGKLVLINKDKYESSFYVVKKIRQAIQNKINQKIKIGHAILVFS